MHRTVPCHASCPARLRELTRCVHTCTYGIGCGVFCCFDRMWHLLTCSAQLRSRTADTADKQLLPLLSSQAGCTQHAQRCTRPSARCCMCCWLLLRCVSAAPALHKSRCRPSESMQILLVAWKHAGAVPWWHVFVLQVLQVLMSSNCQQPSRLMRDVHVEQ